MRNKNQKGKLSASMTVEASYVMAVVLLSLSVMIRTAYVRCQKYTEIMHLHHVVEQLRNQEADGRRGLIHGQVIKTAGKTEGYVRTEMWEKRIEAAVYEPEERLRKIAVFEKKE